MYIIVWHICLNALPARGAVARPRRNNENLFFLMESLMRRQSNFNNCPMYTLLHSTIWVINFFLSQLA